MKFIKFLAGIAFVLLMFSYTAQAQFTYQEVSASKYPFITCSDIDSGDTYTSKWLNVDKFEFTTEGDSLVLYAYFDGATDDSLSYTVQGSFDATFQKLGNYTVSTGYLKADNAYRFAVLNAWCKFPFYRIIFAAYGALDADVTANGIAYMGIWGKLK